MQRVGKYQLLRKLATGGMAEVFLARAEGPMGFQKRLVVKRILPHFVEDPNFVGMFLGEAKLAAELNHPNLVQIFDFGEADGQYYLAMEFIDGPNLRQLSVAARLREKPLSYALAARLMTFAADGLHAAHELRDENGQLVHLVHRDISPDNILISRNGTVKVVDFGIAKVSNEPSRTKSGVIKGKLAYMPPEQLAREPLDRRSDIFALGVVLYELVAGVMPFDATSEVSIIQAIMNEQPLERARTRQPDVPAELDAIIAKCLEKKADNRYPTCKALHDALEHFISSTGAPVYASDLAQVVNEMVPVMTDSAVSAVSAAGAGSNGDAALGPTVPTRPRSDRHEAEAVEASNGSGPSGRQIAQVAVVLLALGFIGGALAVYRPWEKQRVEHVAAVKPTPVVVAAPVVVDAGPEIVPAAVTSAPVVGARGGYLELRIRPFATVFIDGKPAGQTRLPPIALSAGKHRLRLVNEALGKNVEQDVIVKPGETTVFKLNLNE